MCDYYYNGVVEWVAVAITLLHICVTSGFSHDDTYGLEIITECFLDQITPHILLISANLRKDCAG